MLGLVALVHCIVVFKNPDVSNHPRISPQIFDIIRKFWGRVGCEKIDVRWGTRKNHLAVMYATRFLGLQIKTV